VWKLDMSTQLWTEILPAVSLPSDRTVVAGIYDPPRNRLLFFGGNDPLNGPRNDLWALPLTGTPVWAQLAPAGLIPMERGQARAIYDPVRDRMVVYGGLQAGFPFDDTWALSPTVNVGVPSLQVPGNAGLALAAPRPNPSRDLASFAFTLARPGHTTLEVFDMSGRRVRTLMGSHLPAGSHSASWRGEDDRGAPLADGLYFVRLRSGGEQVTRRVVRVM
jgi:hypothetical protein